MGIGYEEIDKGVWDNSIYFMPGRTDNGSDCRNGERRFHH